MKTNTLRLLAGLTLVSLADGKTIPNYAEADLVLGQTDFTLNLAPLLPNAATLNLPSSVVVDPVTRKVFVSEEGNHRVLRYGSADSLANGAAAEAVFGQFLFTTQNMGVTSDQLGGLPGAIFLDAKGRLWIPDNSGNRVLMYEAASFRSSGNSADRVFGQPNFTTGTFGTTASKMKGPTGVWVDAADKLWVADQGNNRVLRFDNVSTKPSGANADGVLGQPNFTTSTAGTGATGLQYPSGVTLSGTGVLFVACRTGHRVLRFDSAGSLGNGAAAHAVLGQPDFTTVTPDVTATKMERPYGAWITPDDSLWVADTRNHRVLRFNNASTKPSGAAADGVLGQPDFTSKTPAISRRGMDTPYLRPFVDSNGCLWISDLDNSRVLRFSPDATPPLLAVTAPAKVTKKKVVTIKGTASDTYGISKVEYRVGKGPFKRATGTTNWSFKAKLEKGRNVITLLATDIDGIPSLSQVVKIRRK